MAGRETLPARLHGTGGRFTPAAVFGGDRVEARRQRVGDRHVEAGLTSGHRSAFQSASKGMPAFSQAWMKAI